MTFGCAELRGNLCGAYNTDCRLPLTEYSYDELVKVRNVGLRSRKWHRLRKTEKAFMNCVIWFLRAGGKIVSATIREGLEIIIGKLRVVTRSRLLRFGEVKAVEMRIQCARRGIFKWAPQLGVWLRDQAYKLWLGTIQISLEGFYPVESG